MDSELGQNKAFMRRAGIRFWILLVPQSAFLGKAHLYRAGLFRSVLVKQILPMASINRREKG